MHAGRPRADAGESSSGQPGLPRAVSSEGTRGSEACLMKHMHWFPPGSGGELLRIFDRHHDGRHQAVGRHSGRNVLAHIGLI
ncbi:hypothetical protein PSCLAVI8L_100171 [Pseudoclavibacter sp. 8L]|nr:hypothetical protein PSCLAVI8L_100171 [Pseudoclavibacter sp. 8L]